MRILPTIILSMCVSVCSAQLSVQVVLDSVLKRARETSMYAASVNWDSLQGEVRRKGASAKTIPELKPAFEAILNALRDHHGRVLDARTYANIAYFTDRRNIRHSEPREYDQDTWKTVNDPEARFSYKVLDGKVGYLRIVGIGPQVDVQQESRRIRNALIELSGKGVQSWIIDLRYNGGGNMNPMMAGIGPLVGDGHVGSVTGADGRKAFDWEVRNGNFIYFNTQVVDLPHAPSFKSPPRIAVLTSRWTISSGELVAVALKGRPNTRSFGEATGGYTTNTNWEVIDDQVVLTLATGNFCDRKGTVYAINVPVDEEIPFALVKEGEKDACIEAAVKWLGRK